MATYRVVPGSLSVTPTKQSYGAGENVEIRIRCQLERKNGLGSFFAWSSHYKISKTSGELLKTVNKSHSEAPWTDIDTATDDFTENIGPFSEGVLNGVVVVSASG